MEKPLEIAIYIPNEEAKKWLLFQQHYDTFMTLVERGVFNQKSATVTLRFDHLGVLQDIHTDYLLYSRKHMG